ncbi:MAG: DoxX family protein [Nitrospira sp.]|nr:DoxX family protein [Nitrospira sp.]
MHMKLMWGGRVISGLLALLFTMSAVMKLMGGAEVSEGFAHMGLPASLRIPLGILELGCVVIYAVPATAVVGAILLTGYLGGAIVTHLRIGEPVVFQITLGVLVWLGVYLRESRLKSLIPLRT